MIDSGMPYYMSNDEMRVATSQIEQFIHADRWIASGRDPREPSAFVPDWANPTEWKKYAEYKCKAVWLDKI